MEELDAGRWWRDSSERRGIIVDSKHMARKINITTCLPNISGARPKRALFATQAQPCSAQQCYEGSRPPPHRPVPPAPPSCTPLYISQPFGSSTAQLCSICAANALVAIKSFVIISVKTLRSCSLACRRSFHCLSAFLCSFSQAPVIGLRAKVACADLHAPGD